MDLYPWVGAIDRREWTYYPQVGWEDNTEGIGWGGVWVLGRSMSRIRTQPLPSFFWFWGFSSWSIFGLVALRLRGVRLASRFALACLQYNASVTSDGGRWTIHPPPPIGLSSLLPLGLLGIFGWGTATKCNALQNVAWSRPHSPTSFRRSTKRGPERDVGRQPYCHANATDVGRPNSVLSFRCAKRTFLLDKFSLDYLNFSMPHTL